LDLKPGSTLAEGRFHLEAFLGRGSMGVVFRARDGVLGRDVALKTLPRSSADCIIDLKREFRRLTGLSHPNLIELYELFAVDGSCFFTMELLDARPFVERFEHVRARGQWTPEDVTELRGRLEQLGCGLGALHRTGQVHRDIKPSNVMVTRDDRVVLLDFGLASHLREADSAEATAGFYGTAAYMAPEQALGEPAQIAADWYSVGATLYETLTGRLPFDGSLAQIFAAKQLRRPQPPSRLISGVPPSLDEITMRLLEADPRRRAGSAELGALLDTQGRGSARGRALTWPAAGDLDSPFVGRAYEMETLRRAFDALRAGAPSVVEIRGTSGIGKSEIVRRFRKEIEADASGLFIGGRCHPQESIPFKALDPIVDMLSGRLLAWSDDRVQSIRPRNLPALLRLFPVLARVPAFATDEIPSPAASGEDLHEIRRQAIQGLRELLTRLGEQTDLVLWVDDAQWADRDSAPVLREILREPAPPRLLLLLSYRGDDVHENALLCAVDELVQAGEVSRQQLDLEPLPAEETHVLAEALLKGAGLRPDGATARAVIAESRGSPFFVEELVRHLAQRDAEVGSSTWTEGPPAVAEVTRGRLDGIASDARTLVELVAVAGGPIEASVALDLAGLGSGGWPLVYRMCNQSLLREGEVRSERPETLETYHDRVRETLLAALSPEGLRSRHRQLAEGLRTRPAIDPERLMRHFLGAGDEIQGADYARLAAERASAALAFERAAELYETAVRLRGERDEDWRLREARAAALGAAGRGGAAGQVYEEAAACAARVGQDAETKASLSLGAAEHYLYAGNLSDGMRVLRAVLHELDVPLPAHPKAAIRTALGMRFRFVLRGTRADRLYRGPGRSDRRQILRLEAMWKAARGTAMLDHTLGDVLGVRHLLGALELGDLSRIVRALCMEAATEATIGGRWLRRRSEALVDAAAEFARRTAQPYDDAVVLVHRATLALLSSRFTDCVEHCRAAEEIFRSRCRGVAYELNIVHSFHCGALALLGRLRELGALTSSYLDEAQARGDRYAFAFFCSGDQVLVPLARGDADLALARVRESMVGVPEDHFNSFHFYELLGTTRVELYRGDALRAWSRMEEAWPRLRASGFLQLEGIGTVLHYLYGCAALAAASHPRTEGPGGAAVAAGPPSHLLAAVKQAERFLRGVTIPMGRPLGAVLRSGLHALRGDAAAQIRVLDEAIAGCDAIGMALHRESLRLQRSQLEGDTVTAETDRATALGWMESEGVSDAYALARSTAPVPLAHLARLP
jgi:eukaryotic-like serine/threonine-protein kinase